MNLFKVGFLTKQPTLSWKTSAAYSKRYSMPCPSMLSGFHYHSMAQLWAMGAANTLNICTVTASVLNKQLQGPEKDWPSA